MKRALLLKLILFCALGGYALAKAPVWKVSKGDNHLYIGGTIHLLSENDYPLPQAFETAYQQAEVIWFEVDLANLNTPGNQAKILSAIAYQDQRLLSTELNPETYNKLSAFLNERQIPIASMNHLTPAGLMLSLTTLELTNLGLIDETAGVDLHFEDRAAKDAKNRLHLETIDQQIAFISSLNQVDPNRMVESIIEDVGKTQEMWQSLLSAWKVGDMQALEKTGISDMKNEFPTIYQAMLVKRNNHWMQDLARMIESKEVEFVLVGALHLAGEHGLINQLNKAGYTTKQLANAD